MHGTRKKWAAAAVLAVAVPLLGIQIVELRSELGGGGSRGASATASAAARAESPAPKLDPDAAARSGAATYSNIYRYDYVGPETCGKCHAQNFELWRSHPHAKMNRNATASSVVGDFSGVKLVYGDGHVVFAKGGGELTMTIYRRDAFVRQLKVTRTVGSRFVQMYVGTESEGPEPPDDPVYTREGKLPFAYSITRGEWFPETYDETPNVDEYDAHGELNPYYSYFGKPRGDWQRACIKCHNTYPYAARFEAASDKRLVGFPAADVALADAPHKRSRGPTPELDPSELVTLGISCESCHFGGREHALKGAATSFVPRSQDLLFPKATDALALGAGRRDPYVVNAICNQCHTADTPGPIYPNGAGSWNSREAKDLAAGACASRIRCTSCHNPHEAGPTRADVADAPNHVAACTSCHEKFAAPGPAAAHSSHGASVTCLDCHMPRVVHGLAGMLRSHRISSPTDARMLRGDWPNACNACHLDRSVAWTVAELEGRWKKRLDLGAGFSPLDEPAGPRWLRHPEPMVRQVALDAYSRSPLGKAMLGSLLPALDDPSPPARMFAVLGIERILGARIAQDEYTPWAAPDERRRQAAALAERVKR